MIGWELVRSAEVLIARGHREHDVFCEYGLDKVELLHRAATMNMVHEAYLMATAYHAPKKLKDFLPANTAAAPSAAPDRSKLARLARLGKGKA